ncbi:MAG: DEAD/DEAH box helicase [Desulfamplus sp.]|nr:DEAD/DEAH box helicase [Desulfamplus sp.]
MSKNLQERVMNISQSSKEIARKMWQLQRARKKEGGGVEEVHPYQRGVRVASSSYGEGKVILSTKACVSVHYPSVGTVQDYFVADLNNTNELKLLDKKQTLDQSDVATNPHRKLKSKKISLGEIILDVHKEIISHRDSEGKEAVYYEYIEGTVPCVKPRAISLVPELLNAFQKLNFFTFFSHQIEAREALLRSENIILCTPTSSGKTNAFNPTVLDTLLTDSEATALYLYPLVALSIDQCEKIISINNNLPDIKKLEIGILNSTIKDEEKQKTKKANNRILITTPDTLHYVLLRNKYPNWRRFFANLRFVVLDEAHIYKGVFGINVANIVRRLFIRCRSEGHRGEPQIIISTATVFNPKSLASNLTGLNEDNFTLIKESGAPQPIHHRLAFYGETVDICSQLLDRFIYTKDEKRPIRIIVFCRSIRRVKSIANILQIKLKKDGYGYLIDQIATYYSGHFQRDNIFRKLIDGSISLLVTTNALMAGIDIGTLDVCIVDGFPGLIMDARQMFGRAGRGSEGASIFIGNKNNVFDQYYIENPSQLFVGEPESAVINPSNPFLWLAHFRCAAHEGMETWDKEGPLNGEYAHYLGDNVQYAVDELINKGELFVKNAHFIGNLGSPHKDKPLNDLRGGGQRDYSIYNEKNIELEKKREWYAFRDAHPNAILDIGGSLYKVNGLNQELQEVRCSSIDSETSFRTRGKAKSIFKINSIQDCVDDNLYTRSIGHITIVNMITGYLTYRIIMEKICRNKQCNFCTSDTEISICWRCNSKMRLRQREEIIDDHLLNCDPPLKNELETIGVWIEFKQDFVTKYYSILNDIEKQFSFSLDLTFEFAIHSTQHALRKIFPEVVLCDPNDINGLHQSSLTQLGEQILFSQDNLPKIYIYDNFQEGLGLSEELYDNPEVFFTRALNLIESCNCTEDVGCPICLNLYQCSFFNTQLSKLSARLLMRIFLKKETKTLQNDLKNFFKKNEIFYN